MCQVDALTESPVHLLTELVLLQWRDLQALSTLFATTATAAGAAAAHSYTSSAELHGADSVSISNTAHVYALLQALRAKGIPPLLLAAVAARLLPKHCDSGDSSATADINAAGQVSLLRSTRGQNYQQYSMLCSCC
jgi:hypothetical protein